MTRVHAWLLALLAVLTAWSIAGMQLAAGAVLLAFLADRGWTRAEALRGPVLGFAGICLVSALLSPALGRFELFAWREVLLAWIAASLGSRLEPQELDRVATAWMLAMGAAAAWGILQAFTGWDLLALLHLRAAPIEVDAPWKGHHAALGFFNSRLTFAHALLVPLGLAGAFTLAGRGRQRVLGLALGAVLLAALVLSFGRAGWWGALATAAVLLGLRGGKRPMLGLAALLAVALLVPGVRARFASSVSVSANEDRVFIWARAREVIADHPVLGVGFGAYPRVAQPYYDRADPNFPMHTWAHDTPLSLLAETGPTGLAAYLWLWLSIYVLGVKALRTGSAAALGLLAGTLGLHVAALFHDVLYDGEVAFALYLGGGLLAAYGLRKGEVAREARYTARPAETA